MHYVVGWLIAVRVVINGLFADPAPKRGYRNDWNTPYVSHLE